MQCSTCGFVVSKRDKYCPNCKRIPIQRGDIFYADLSGFQGLSQPYQEVLVIQNQKGNKNSPTIICLVGISAKNTNIQNRISKEMLTYNNGLNYITTIDKERILNNSFIGRLDSSAMNEVKGRLAQILFGMTMRVDIKNII
jgi:mRNA-degrading endonuclease toxin of MazEF toxin-antitoxin module